ncbi:ATP-binding protein [Dokdonia ponticola]|uniref:histidine kinase n=1 Tax=Dokdonia ponticola TaxID=2041041 RepID=A0ABV9HSX9_9FLAO
MVTNHANKDNLRSRAEAQIKKLPDRQGHISVEKAKVLLHELDVHQIELEMQNQELREAQHRLVEISDQYTDLFDFAPVGYLLLNSKGVIVNLNLTACSMLGIERQRLIGKPFSAYMTKGESTTFFLKLREAFKTGVLPSFELRIKYLENREFVALVHGTVDIQVDQDNPICRVAIQDITELRKMEALQKHHEDLQKEKDFLEWQNEKLESEVIARTKDISDALESERHINQMKSDFISVASHELRTPFTIIMSSAILIERFKNLGRFDKIDPHITRIKLSIKNFTTILDDFLSLEKLEKDMMRVKKETFNILEFINTVIEEMEVLLKKGQRIQYMHEGRVEIKQDKKILHNILTNLLTNAIKYSETDVVLTTHNRNGELVLKVKDEGIGIPEEEQEHLFKRFFRARNVKDFQGTGLGLSIVECYLELLEGTINFTSKLNKGSTFTIVI